jgi:hypothetical protein
MRLKYDVYRVPSYSSYEEDRLFLVETELKSRAGDEGSHRESSPA